MKKLIGFAISVVLAVGSGAITTQVANSAPFDTTSCTVNLGAGSTDLGGTAANDVICVTGTVDFSAGDGDDIVYFAPGSSGSVKLGAGNDTLYGEQAASLVISGEAGDDLIYGSAGSDTISGGASAGRDRIFAGAGDDRVNGDSGEVAYVDLGDGNDVFNGGNATDSEVLGGQGNDQITGTVGDDDLDGGDGLDEISGLAGADVLKGGPGDDLLAGGDGTDTLDGGFGLNQCDYSSGEVKTTTCVYDDSAPEIKIFKISTNLIDSTSIANKVDVTMEVSDSTGVESITMGCSTSNSFVFLINYSNNGTGWLGVSDGTPYQNPTSGAGVGKNIKFTTSVNFPVGASPGKCNLIAHTRDTIGNQIGGVQLGAFEIVRSTAGDDVGPAITVSQSATEIDVSTGAKTLNVEASLSDPSKIQWVSIRVCSTYSYYAWWDSSTKSYFASATIMGASSHLGYVNAGLETDAKFTFPIELGMTTRSQSCGIVVSSQDRNGKSSSSTLPNALKIVNNLGGDQAGPLLENFTYTKTVDVGASGQKFVFAGKITDLSGFKWFNIRLHNQDYSRYFDVLHFQADKYGAADYVVTGGSGSQGPIPASQGNKNALDFSYSFEIPFGTKPGTYRISIMGEDLLGNAVVDPGTYNLEVSRTSPGQPSAPSGLTVNGNGADAVTLSWTAPAILGDPVLKDYEIQYKLDSESTWKTVSDGFSTTTQLPISNLLGGKMYQFRVRGENGGGQGSWSAITSYATPGAKAPSAPRNVVAKSVSSKTFVASWEGPSDAGASKITDFVAQISLDGSKWVTIGHAISPSLSITVSNLLPATGYLFRSAWVNAIGQGSFSEVIKIQTLAETTKSFVVPSAPTAPTLSKLTETSYKFAWKPPTSLGGDKLFDYTSEYSVDKGKTWVSLESTVSLSTSVKISGLKKGRLYLVRSAGINGAGKGAWSKVLSITPR